MTQPRTAAMWFRGDVRCGSGLYAGDACEPQRCAATAAAALPRNGHHREKVATCSPAATGSAPSGAVLPTTLGAAVKVQPRKPLFDAASAAEPLLLSHWVNCWAGTGVRHTAAIQSVRSQSLQQQSQVQPQPALVSPAAAQVAKQQQQQQQPAAQVAKQQKQSVTQVAKQQKQSAAPPQLASCSAAGAPEQQSTAAMHEPQALVHSAPSSSSSSLSTAGQGAAVRLRVWPSSSTGKQASPAAAANVRQQPLRRSSSSSAFCIASGMPEAVGPRRAADGSTVPLLSRTRSASPPSTRTTRRSTTGAAAGATPLASGRSAAGMMVLTPHRPEAGGRAPPCRTLRWWLAGGVAFAAVSGGAVVLAYSVLSLALQSSMIFSLAWKAATGVAAAEGLALGGWGVRSVCRERGAAAAVAEELARVRLQAARDTAALREALSARESEAGQRLADLSAVNDRLGRIVAGLQADNTHLQAALERASAERKALESAAALEAARAAAAAASGAAAAAGERVLGEVGGLARTQSQLLSLVCELREDLLGLVGGSSGGDAPQPAAAPPAEEQQGQQQGQQQAAADAAPLSSGSVVAVAGEHDLLAASREGSFSSVSGASCLLNNGRRLSSVRGSVDAALTAAVCSALEL